MTKLLKNKKGFTLVEVIVVAVIVLILAAVAIPLYQGYVRESRENAANNVAATVVKTIGSALSVGDFADPTAACAAVNTPTVSGNISTATIGAAADNKNVSWDSTRWTVACAVVARTITVTAAAGPALANPVVMNF